MKAKRAPMVAAGRGRSPEELSEVSRRGGLRGKASKATTRALGREPKRTLSDDELEAWAVEQLKHADKTEDES